MGFIRVLKNKAYFKRFQVKYRRRREGKTDYYARRRLVLQDKNKYDTPKYRFVVRITNSRIICQIISSTIIGDIVHASADSKELMQYGIKYGLTNYAAAYCTGLLLARRMLTKLKLDDQFVGNTDVNGEVYHIEEEDNERRPFKALLDVGIRIVTTGNKVFGCVKGACDGGLHIPHSERRFPGYTINDEKEGTYDAAVHRERIFGLHVKSYMDLLKEEDMDKYKKQFSKYIKLGVDPDKMEDMYRAAHEAIRKNPNLPKGDKKKVEHLHRREGNFIVTHSAKYRRCLKLTKEQRRLRVKRKIEMCIKDES